MVGKKTPVSSGGEAPSSSCGSLLSVCTQRRSRRGGPRLGGVIREGHGDNGGPFGLRVGSLSSRFASTPRGEPPIEQSVPIRRDASTPRERGTRGTRGEPARGRGVRGEPPRGGNATPHKVDCSSRFNPVVAHNKEGNKGTTSFKATFCRRTSRRNTMHGEPPVGNVGKGRGRVTLEVTTCFMEGGGA